MRAVRLCVALAAALSGQADGARAVMTARQKHEAALGNEDVQKLQQDTRGSPLTDTAKLASVLKLGLTTVTSAIRAFTAEPLDVASAVNATQAGLWEVVLKIVPEERHRSEEMTTAKGLWDQAFGSTLNVTQDVVDFHTTGDTGKLVSALKAITSTALTGCSATFPEEARYFTALGELVDGIGESWGEFSHGSAARAVEVVWSAVQSSVDDVIPRQWSTDETYQLVMASVDEVVGGLSAHVLDYKRRILSSQVCYPQRRRQKRVRPSHCRDGFEWDQGKLCFPRGSGHGASCLEACTNQAGLCESFCGGGRACCRQGHASDPAECEGARGFIDYSFTFGSSWQYHQCVTPGPRLVLSVSGAGTPGVNGLYARSGMHSGRPRYTKAQAAHKTVLEWSETRNVWRLYIDRTMLGFGRPTLYMSKEDTRTFPTSGWVATEGEEPIPVVASRAGQLEGPTSFVQAGAGANASGRRGWWSTTPYGAHEAACDMSSEYNQKSGEWCYKKCPSGFHPNGVMCIQECGGDFPAEGYGTIACGTGNTELMLAMSEMVTMAAAGAAQVYNLMDEMREKGVQAENISSTVNAFIQMGKPFARPQCPGIRAAPASFEVAPEPTDDQSEAAEPVPGSIDAALKLSEIFVLGLNAITSGVQVFTVDPDVDEGVHATKANLWEVVLKIVPEDHLDSENMAVAKDVWDQAFGDTPSVGEDVLEFRSTGDTTNLVNALKTILSTALNGCLAMFPEAGQYFPVLNDFVDGLGDSWEEFSEGNAALSVQLLWEALKYSVDDVVPLDLTTDATYALVMGNIDETVGRLSRHVLEFKRRVLNSKVCYKRTQRRERVQPSPCREGSEWEQVGGWCLQQCPRGFEAAGESCVQPCGGEYPAEGAGGSVCGTDERNALHAMSEMMTMVTNGALEAHDLADATRDEAHSGALSNTINVLVDMGKPFARPECPIYDV